MDVLTLHIAPDLGAEVPIAFIIKAIGAVNFREGTVGTFGVLGVSRTITYVDVKMFKSVCGIVCVSGQNWVCIDVLHN